MGELMNNETEVLLNAHYKLPATQRADLSRRLKEIFSRPSSTKPEATGNSGCVVDPNKSEPVPDWWKK
jgi:hypothetical protein